MRDVQRKLYKSFPPGVHDGLSRQAVHYTYYNLNRDVCTLKLIIFQIRFMHKLPPDNHMYTCSIYLYKMFSFKSEYNNHKSL